MKLINSLITLLILTDLLNIKIKITIMESKIHSEIISIKSNLNGIYKNIENTIK